MTTQQEQEVEQQEMLYEFSEDLFSENIDAWFEFESMRIRFMRALGLSDVESLELACKLLLFAKPIPA